MKIYDKRGPKTKRVSDLDRGETFTFFAFGNDSSLPGADDVWVNIADYDIILNLKTGEAKYYDEFTFGNNNDVGSTFVYPVECELMIVG